MYRPILYISERCWLLKPKSGWCIDRFRNPRARRGWDLASTGAGAEGQNENREIKTNGSYEYLIQIKSPFFPACPTITYPVSGKEWFRWRQGGGRGGDADFILIVFLKCTFWPSTSLAVQIGTRGQYSNWNCSFWNFELRVVFFSMSGFFPTSSTYLFYFSRICSWCRLWWFLCWLCTQPPPGVSICGQNAAAAAAAGCGTC